jgi:hypothetical protein
LAKFFPQYQEAFSSAAGVIPSRDATARRLIGGAPKRLAQFPSRPSNSISRLRICRTGPGKNKNIIIADFRSITSIWRRGTTNKAGAAREKCFTFNHEKYCE